MIRKATWHTVSACFVLAGMVLTGGCTASRPAEAVQQYAYYPPSPDPVRIVALGSVGPGLRSGRPRSGLRRFVTGERGDANQMGLVRPLSVAVRDGKVVVCDIGLGAVVQMNPAKGRLESVIRQDQPQPVKPVAVAADLAGNVFVADAGGGAVLKVTVDGTVAGRYRLGEGQTTFEPIGLAVSSNRLYAVNRAARRVEVFDLAAGRHVGSVGGDGLGFPVDVAVDREGRIGVVDLQKCQVAIYRPDGTLATKIGSAGDRPGQFARPRGLAMGDDGILYVADAASQRVQVFDGDGQLLMSFGQGDRGVGALTLPAGLVTASPTNAYFSSKLPKGFSAAYLIFVANQLGPGRIGVYAFGRFEDSPRGVGRDETNTAHE